MAALREFSHVDMLWCCSAEYDDLVTVKLMSQNDCYSTFTNMHGKSVLDEFYMIVASLRKINHRRRLFPCENRYGISALWYLPNYTLLVFAAFTLICIVQSKKNGALTFPEADIITLNVKVHSFLFMMTNLEWFPFKWAIQRDIQSACYMLMNERPLHRQMETCSDYNGYKTKGSRGEDLWWLPATVKLTEFNDMPSLFRISSVSSTQHNFLKMEVRRLWQFPHSSCGYSKHWPCCDLWIMLT